MRLTHKLLMTCAVAAVAVSGCTNGFVYNRLDTLARWYVGNLVTLDESQQAQLRGWLGQSLVWHRDNEIGRYERFLRDLSARIGQGPDPALPQAAIQQAE